MDLDNTIVAVSSPRGNSSRALLRVTGSDVFEKIERVGVIPKNRQLVACNLDLPEGSLPALCLAFQASSSYTCQDTVELSIPNNRFVIASVLQRIIEVTDGRHAQAGEFTARAFFNGRLTLPEAEGVCATISANNDGELRGAALLRKGSLNGLVSPLSENISKTLSLVEAGIDFTDAESVVAITNERLLDSIDLVSNSIQMILDGKIAMETLQHLPHVVIAGSPNAGKSTLFNSLLGYKRVVVSPVSGTTRDVIQEPVWFGNKEAKLIDIAGFEDSDSSLTAATQRSAKRVVKDANIIIWCVAPEEHPPSNLNKTIVVHTKSDLCRCNQQLSICAISGEGLDQLKREVESVLSSTPSPSEDALAILPRHEQHLRSAITSLVEARENYSAPELCATSLRETLNALGSITGTVTPDEILGEVFSSFCVGK
jgi:tRNA modification GTPase|tara:strand:+ start:434 stop:1717 length:1284 start_codon:yes stop_codon:yes gene_type:complete